MTMLVTLAEADFHLRRDTSDDDSYVLTLIEAASGMVIDYLKSEVTPYITELDSNDEPVPIVDSNGDYTVKPQVKAATLILLGELYRNREGIGAFGANYLPRPVVAILYPLRDPASV